MDHYSIALAIGSIRRESINRRLATALLRLAPPEFSFTELTISDIPLYNQDDESNPAASVIRLKKEITAARGLLIVSPEYNRSIPGVLKNALDQASRPRGQIDWAAKPAGIIGASTGAIGTALAQQHLRNVLAYLDVPTMGQPEGFIRISDGFFDQEGNITSAETKKFLQRWMDHYVAWVEAHSS